MVNYKKLGKVLIWRCKQKKVGSNQLPTVTMAEPEDADSVPSILLPCASCNRTFRPEALAKHTKVCEKTLMKKRKQFDSSKQRLQGTDIENFIQQPVPKTTRKKEIPVNVSKSKWKEKAELARTLQTMKKTTESPLSAQIKPSDHEECPFCGRSFGPKAFERHTEFCKEQHQKLKLAHNNNNNNSEARERLKVRTTYRGPLSNKVLNRDRYQPHRNRDPSPLGLPPTESVDEGNKSRGLIRNNSLRSSFRSKSETTPPPPPLRRTMTQINTSTRGTRSSTSDLSTSVSSQNIRTISNNKPRLISKEPIDKRETEKYNPYLSAERQMLELLGTDDSTKNTTLPEINNSPPIQSSLTSAFVKYSSPNKTPSVENLKSDNKENNNVTPEIINFPPLNEKMDKHKNFSLSNLSLCSVVSIDSIDCNKNSFSSKVDDTTIDDFQHSFSAIDYKTNRMYGGKSKVNLQQMLYGSQSPEHTDQIDLNRTDTVSKGNLEACEAELLISMLEFEKMLKSSPSSSPETPPNLCYSLAHTAKEEAEDEENKDQKNFGNSNDSAYSSLTRSNGADGDSGKMEMSKFCHECGAKYPIAVAKFCCNCGMRRISL